MANLHRRILVSSSLAQLSDVRCRESSSACSAEERASSHQLIIIRAGVFIKHAPTASRHSLVAEPMQALFLNRHEAFRVSHPTDRGDDCTVLELEPSAVDEVISRLDPGVGDRPETPFRITHAPVSPAARLALHRLRAAPVRAGDELAHEERMLAILDRIVGDGYRAHGRSGRPRRESTLRARRDLVERTREALAVAPATPWSLAALAREVASSPFHLTRVFRSVTGLPVHQYLVRLRLALALEDLRGGGGHLSAVAFRAGFASHSHFTTAFRQVFGVAPSAAGTIPARGGRRAG